MQRRRRRERRFRPGMRVVVAKDCRENGDAGGKEGILEGHFWMFTDKRYRGPRKHFWVNPRIRLDDGSVIWGIECWWYPAKEGEAWASAKTTRGSG